MTPQCDSDASGFFCAPSRVERWRVGTIARQLGVHHATVDRVLSQAGLPKAEQPHRASLINPYLPFALKTLEQYPPDTERYRALMVSRRMLAHSRCRQTSRHRRSADPLPDSLYLARGTQRPLPAVAVRVTHVHRWRVYARRFNASEACRWTRSSCSGAWTG